MGRAATAIALTGLALAACGKSEKTKTAEIENCSAITLDAPGIARCLADQYRWKNPDAAAAGQRRQRELDSAAVRQRDSLWKIDEARHQSDLTNCASQGGDVGRCLTDRYGWDASHAAAAFDSLWRRQTPRHLQEIGSCQRRKTQRLGSCLMLYFKWDPKHALALDDSLVRARTKAQRR
jgi:hypothetical protein